MIERPIDKDLKRMAGMTSGSRDLSRTLAPVGVALVLLLLGAFWAASATGGDGQSTVFVIGAIIAGYMAINIGANDVSNNMGPAVGARALTMPVALLIAAACEAAGALLAGGDVVTTISSELLVPDGLGTAQLVRVMLSAMLAAALWINVSTIIRAPVSTTHSIVGAVIGAGIAAAGLSAASWPTLGLIASGWVVSPILSGIIAALALLLTRQLISDRLDKLAAARVWVPVFVAAMAGIFTLYLAAKGLERIWQPGTPAIVALAALASILAWGVARPLVATQSLALENRRKHVAGLFRIPLVIAAAILSFAHGANDISNAIGPLMAIANAIGIEGHDTARVPAWLMSIGALGIVAGLALFGPGLIQRVGAEITKLNEIRAFCVALATASTVLIASTLGMPVSTTHIAVGAVFGIGFLREYLSHRDMERKAVPRYARYVDPKALNATPEAAFATARSSHRRRLIRRRHVLNIFGAWTITLPCSAGMAALVYLMLANLVR